MSAASTISGRAGLDTPVHRFGRRFLTAVPLPSRGAMLGLALLASTSGTQAALLISGTVLPLGGSYRYEASVINTDLQDYLFVSLLDAPLGDLLIGPNPTSPPGFQASYDSGLGIVDFVADLDTFGAGATKGTFVFESLSPPGPGIFATVAALDDTLTSVPGSVH